MARQQPPPEQFHTPFGSFELQRYPARRNERLRAWNTADRLLLEAVSDLGWQGDHALVVNDEHGALTVALQPTELWTDSALAARGAAANLARNGLTSPVITWSTSHPTQPAKFVVMRIPKQLAYFEYQLAVLGKLLPKGSHLLAAGMDKHLSPRTAGILEGHFGPTERYPGKRRARVFHARNAAIAGAEAAANNGYSCRQLGARLTALPNVFSHDRLDSGSRLLLEKLDVLDPVTSLIDLACGNGVLGLAAYSGGLASRVFFCDESAMAVQSARENSQRLFPRNAANFTFFHGDGLLDFDGELPALIVCNPPFHSSHTVNAFVGARLVTQAAEKLASGGSLLLVANRHLEYGRVLNRHFRRVERISGDRKFNLWLATKAG